MNDPGGKPEPGPKPRPGNPPNPRVVLAAACLLIAALYASLANLKGIGTDEGFRLGIINGGREYTTGETGTRATWGDVLEAITPYAYQPLYFILQNTVMRAGHTHDEGVLKGVNIFFLWLSLQGLLALSRGWALVPRLFLLGLFSLNAFLLMHVLQLREYIMGIAFYVWSTWLALHLDARRLERPWADVGWFSAYGGLLVLGFFTQTWAVFPGVAQGLFLVTRRAGDRLRFYVYLALSYMIVLALVEPYLASHRQKVDIGRWGSESTPLWSRLADGFHLVLSGQSFGYSATSDSLFWFWLLLLAAGAGLFVVGKFRPDWPPSRPAGGRQGRLMLLSLAVFVAFQIGYFLKVDTLSVWPRYFALHYFFVLWLVALAFNRLYDLAAAPARAGPVRAGLRLAVAAVFAVMIYSGIFQTRTYCREPYFDSGLSAETNWRLLGAGLARIVRPGDVLLTQDFVHAWTLTFTRSFSNPVLPAPQLREGVPPQADRFVYLVTDPNAATHQELVARLAARGYGSVHAEPLSPATTAKIIPGWSVLIFERP